MNNKPDDRRVRKTKKALRQGLAALMEQKNIKDITVRELTELADIHRGTFYLHYKDIYDLQECIENEIITEVTDIIGRLWPSRPGSSPKDMLLVLLKYIGENIEICSVLLGNNSNRSFVDKLSAIIQEHCLDNWVRHFHVGADSSEVKYFSRYMVSGYIAVIGKWAAGGMQESQEQMAELMSQIGLYGIGLLADR